MYKKIFGFLLIFCFLLTPQLVFANSLYFETRIEEHTMKLNINKDGHLDMETSDGVSNSSFDLDIGEKAVQPVYDFFLENIENKDEIDYISSPLLEGLTDSPESYVLTICEDRNCKTYFSEEKPLFTVEELENSEVFNVLETKIETFLEKVILIIAVIAIFILVAPIFIFVIVIAKISQGKTKNYTVETETAVDRKAQLLNQLQQISKEKETKGTSHKSSKRKRDPWTDNDKNDPFSL